MQGLRDLRGQRPPEKWRHLRRSDKVAALPVRARWHGAELGVVARVVTQTWGVQSGFHELVKADPSAAVSYRFQQKDFESAGYDF